MYVTKGMLDKIILDLTLERDNLGEPKRRGKGRDYSKAEADEFILDTYTILICKRLKVLIAKGTYSIDRVVQHLRSMDWSYYSFASKAYKGKELDDLMKIRYKKETETFFLSVQGVYLTEASEAVSGILESYE